MKLKVYIKNDKEHFKFEINKNYVLYSNELTKKSILKKGNFKVLLKEYFSQLNSIKTKDKKNISNVVILKGFLKYKKYNLNSDELKSFKEQIYHNHINEMQLINKNVFENK